VIIRVEGLTKTFRTRERNSGFKGSLSSFINPQYRIRQAVKPTSFSLDAGEVLAFIGPNGAGKSTTIKMLTGILHPSAGSASVLGLVPWEQRHQLAFHIASVYGQKSQLWYHLPPQDTFDLLARIYELDQLAYRKRRDFLIEVFAIAEYMRTPARKLSLGERMRCELAAALLHQPSIVFLDEPTIGLDVIAKQRIRDLIARLNVEEGLTVFLTSHDAGDIEQVCKRAIVINHGEIVLDAPVETLKREYLRVKTVDLLLGDAVEALVSIDSESGEQCLRGELAVGREARLGKTGIKVLEARDYRLKLEIDIGRCPLEPVIAAIMQHGHVVDMNIADPPMEEIISLIYQQVGQDNQRPEADPAVRGVL
jgi:ABC-2 type transport system ATP-binding protein